jgi:hypothetical protein
MYWPLAWSCHVKQSRLSRGKVVAKPSKLRNMKSTKTKLNPIKITASQKAQVKNRVIMDLTTLKELGVSEAQIKNLLNSQVIRRHDFMTCGDYNL